MAYVKKRKDEYKAKMIVVDEPEEEVEAQEEEEPQGGVSGPARPTSATARLVRPVLLMDAPAEAVEMDDWSRAGRRWAGSWCVCFSEATAPIHHHTTPHSPIEICLER